MGLAARVLVAGIAVAAGRGRRPGGGAVPAGGGCGAGGGHVGYCGAMSVSSLAVIAPCGLPLALSCRRLWRLGHRRGAWWVGVALGAFTVAVSVFVGLLGPVAIALCAVVFSLPAWGAWWWLAHNG